MFSTDIDYSVKLKSVLTSQDKLLSEICDTQKKLRESVNERDWDELQYHLASFDALSNKFSELEEVYELIKDSYYKKVSDIYITFCSKSS